MCSVVLNLIPVKPQKPPASDDSHFMQGIHRRAYLKPLRNLSSDSLEELIIIKNVLFSFLLRCYLIFNRALINIFIFKKE